MAFAANRDVATLIRQAKEYHPRIVACETGFDASLLPPGIDAILGEGATAQLAGMQEADVVVNGVSGFLPRLPR